MNQNTGNENVLLGLRVYLLLEELEALLNHRARQIINKRATSVYQAFPVLTRLAKPVKKALAKYKREKEKASQQLRQLYTIMEGDTEKFELVPDSVKEIFGLPAKNSLLAKKCLQQLPEKMRSLLKTLPSLYSNLYAFGTPSGFTEEKLVELEEELRNTLEELNK